jgi:hypothetical protein
MNEAAPTAACLTIEALGCGASERRIAAPDRPYGQGISAAGWAA